ncbi:MAG: hypothetical protein U0872_07460 [Planctomycetaceae bacterium]
MTASLVATAGFRCDDLAGWHIVLGGWNWKIRPDHADEWQRQLLFHPLKSSTGTIIKRGPHRTVRQLDALTGGGTYFLKVFIAQAGELAGSNCCEASRQIGSSRYRLAVRRQVPTAEVVAVGFQDGLVESERVGGHEESSRRRRARRMAPGNGRRD